MEIWENFGDYVKLQMKAFGEELKRRADRLNLEGLDGVNRIHIEFDIPSQTDKMVWPSFKLEFICYSKTNANSMCGEILSYRVEDAVKVITSNDKLEDDSYELSDEKNKEE